MKPRHIPSERLNARAILVMCNIAIGQDFHTLRSTQVDALLTQADLAHYHKPSGASGSRARYFHDLLQRRAAAKPS